MADDDKPDPHDVIVQTEDYRNYVITNKENEVDVPRLQYITLVSGYGYSLNYNLDASSFEFALKDLKLQAAKLGVTHVFGIKPFWRSQESSTVYSVCGDGYRPVKVEEEPKEKQESRTI